MLTKSSYISGMVLCLQSLAIHVRNGIVLTKSSYMSGMVLCLQSLATCQEWYCAYKV